MAGASLLTLLDDIATVLDDIAVMSKVAAKKTASVLGDDLALNAQQVSGVAAEREIPVVWAVAKGSFRNKLILVPIAWALSQVAPWLIMPLLLVGGLYLCFEGAEKILEKLTHHAPNPETSLSRPMSSDAMQAYEQRKIQGAIRTDFILSAEIIVIALGTVQGQTALDQIIVMSFVAFLMTVGVYGLVAGIVKLDDLGFYLERRSQGKGLQKYLGQILIHAAPRFMKLLTVIGTIAMFLVGGSIVAHQIAVIHHAIEFLMQWLAVPHAFLWLVSGIAHGLLGLLMGGIVLAIYLGFQKIRARMH
jgi:predicted DNA repair protein MutK